MRGWACAVAAAVAAVGGATPAVADQRVVPLTFEGAECTAVTEATYRLPADARLAGVRGQLVGRVVGGTKADQYSRDELALVTGAEIRGRTLTVTLAADPDRCLGSALPGEPHDAPWTAALDVDVSWTIPDVRWAHRETTSLASGRLDYGFSDQLRAQCRRLGDARFRCAFSSFAGDSVVVGVGRLSIGRDDEWPRYRFRVAHIDEYCAAVLRRPLRACRTTSTWRR